MCVCESLFRRTPNWYNFSMHFNLRTTNITLPWCTIIWNKNMKERTFIFYFDCQRCDHLRCSTDYRRRSSGTFPLPTPRVKRWVKGRLWFMRGHSSEGRRDSHSSNGGIWCRNNSFLGGPTHVEVDVLDTVLEVSFLGNFFF